MENTIYFAGGCTLGIIFTVIVVAVAVVASRKGQKPFYKKSTDEYEDDSWACPRCGGTVGVYDMEDKYCSDCGQKIDWRK